MPTLQQQHAELWERYIREECKALERAGAAWVSKNWEAPRVPGKKMPRAKSKPDFSGFLADGRHVVFEAKATLSETSFGFDAISEHQREHLEAADNAGAMSFVYVLDGLRRKWVIPFATIRLCEATRGSFPFPQFPQMEKRAGETWLDCLGQRITEVAS